MPSITNPNDPVAPATRKRFHKMQEVVIVTEGLTKREHFAVMAMQGLLSANATYGGKTDNRDDLCNDAVAHADALIKALNKQINE